ERNRESSSKGKMNRSQQSLRWFAKSWLLCFLAVGREGRISKGGFMPSKRKLNEIEMDRRAVLMAGLAGASALVFGSNNNLFAAEDKGVERKTGKQVDSMIPGFPKVGQREITLQPGASTKATMKNPMICEC